MKLHLLGISGINPSKNNKNGFPFITNRFRQLKAFDVKFDLYAIYFYDSFIFKIIKKIVKVKISEKINLNQIHTDNVCYKCIYEKNTLSNYIFKYSFFRGNIIGCTTGSNYDLIHAHWIYPHGYIAIKLKHILKIPCVVTAHGSDIHTQPNKNKTIKKRTIYTLENADKSIFVSEALLNQAKEIGYTGNNAVVIPNGVDISLFTIKDKNIVRKQLGVYEDNTFYVGFVGNLVEIKRADRLTEIFIQVKNILPNVKFIIVGDGELRQKLEAESTANNLGVFFTGKVNPKMVPLWMNCFDVLILPSRNEGFPSVIIEAHACGIPTVGSNAGGIPEASGDYGFIVPDGENFEKRFAQQIYSALINEKYSQEEIRKHATCYSWESIVTEEIKIYTQILEGN